MAQAFFQGGSPSNYTIGGTRFWFNRLVDSTSTPPKYEGYRDMGNVVDSSLEQETEEQDHFSSKTGTRRKDRSLVKEISEEILFTLDELSTENLRSFFRAAKSTDVASAQSVGKVDEIAQLDREEVRILGSGYQAALIVVKDITDTTTYVLDTDYIEVSIIGGYTGIARIEGGAIADGDFVRISYDYDVEAHRLMKPATVLEVLGMALFFAVSDTGNEFVRSFRNTQIEPEGAFELNDDDWSTFQLRLKILDDSVVTPTAPFGLFKHYGTGLDI